MKKRILFLSFFIIPFFVLGQFSAELTGGVGYDFSKSQRGSVYGEMLSHEYTDKGVQYPIEFNILEPRSVGGNVLWNFSSNLGLSLGLNLQYVTRNITGNVYEPDTDYQEIQKELKSNIEYLWYGVFLRKEILLRSNNLLFFQFGIGAERNTRISRQDQLVRYRPDVEYYNYVAIRTPAITNTADLVGNRKIGGWEYKQGYLFTLTPKSRIGIAGTFSFQESDITRFRIYEWDNVLQHRPFDEPFKTYYLRFSSMTLDLFLVYNF